MTIQPKPQKSQNQPLKSNEFYKSLYFRLAELSDVDCLAKLGVQWALDYKKAGDGTNMCTEEQWRDLLSHKHAMTRMLVVEIGERIIGFLLCKEGGPNSIVIDIAFVDSQYRSNGVATLLYKVAIELMGANSIELTFARALKNIDFWQALGFRSLTDTPGCAFTMRALCRLQTTPLLVSSQYVPLQELKIKQYMKTKRLELSTRRTGTFYFV